jgi:hypothetical protein
MIRHNRLAELIQKLDGQEYFRYVCQKNKKYSEFLKNCLIEISGEDTILRFQWL